MSQMNTSGFRVVVVGGGFGGVRTALDLARRELPGMEIMLMSPLAHFEYHPALYRMVTGASPCGVNIPLWDIFKDTSVRIVRDSLDHVEFSKKIIIGTSGERYHYTFLVLALGSEPAYFNIPGLSELSFAFNSAVQANRLRRHLSEVFEGCERGTSEEKVCAANVVVVGGGASGVEAAGELAPYLRTLASSYNVDPSMTTVDLIEGASRVLPSLPIAVSRRIQKRLRALGVNLFLNRTLVKEEFETIYLKDMQMKTKTLIWTAGVKPHRILGTLHGLALDDKGRVLLDSYLKARGVEDVFVIGDIASTPYAGMAQTALYDGRYVARTIAEIVLGWMPRPYVSKKTSYAVPVGSGWAAVSWGPLRLYGRLGWWIRRLIDLKFLYSILPPHKAWRVFIFGNLSRASFLSPPFQARK